MIKVRKYWIDDNPYDLKNHNRNHRVWQDITSWCFTQCGIPGETGHWNYETNEDWMDFYFRDCRDAELFILKWM